MKRRGLALGRRFGAAAAAAVLALSLAGDRGRAATVPAVVYGQDPLEVLELKVRPNVIVVLDSSGSMTETVDWDSSSRTAGANTGSGDHPRSKMSQAKGVLRTVFQKNQDKVSFQFGTYTQFQMVFYLQSAGNARFQYWTPSTASPSMAIDATEMTVQGAAGDTLGRGLQSWQVIYPPRPGPPAQAGWNTFYYRERIGSTTYTCTAALPDGTGPNGEAFYARGGKATTAAADVAGSFAAVLKAAINGCPRTTGKNVYDVTYAAGTGQFTITRTLNSNTWAPLWQDNAARPNNIRGALNANTSATQADPTLGSGPFSTGTPFTLLYRPATRSRSVASITRSGSTATVTTSVAHGYANGATIEIAGASQVGYNGIFTITSVPSATTFTYALGTYTPATPATGTMTVILSPAFGNFRYAFSDKVAGSTVHNYQLRAGRLWNGETVNVAPDGSVCGMTFATAKTSPPTLTLQLVATGCGAAQPDRATFQFAGGDWGGNNVSCGGFRSKSALIPCDLQSPPAATQFTMAGPYIDLELPFADTGEPVDLTTNTTAGDFGGASYGIPDAIPDYVEAQDGTWAVKTLKVAPSAKADGSTPIANSLIDIKGLVDTSNQCVTNAAPAAGKLESLVPPGTTGACAKRGFSKLWDTGQTGATTMAGPGPWKLDPIKSHKDPKEKTIVLFVTDGDDTCSGRGGGGSGATDTNALRAAYWAEKLYKPIDATQPASSVQTYVIGFGGAFTSGEPYRLNWIAWGGSGLGQGLTGQPNVAVSGTDDPADPASASRWNDTAANLTALRAKCSTCQDAFVAPDAETLATQLQSIIDQGASDGDFNAQQSITESVFEYVDRASSASKTYSAMSPTSRYQAITPTRFVSSFSLPGFKGQLRAYQNDAGTAAERWSAGGKLWTKVSTAMATCNNSTAGGVAGECLFAQLHGGATDATIAGSAAKIQRRIYTTDRNGVYDFTPQTLMAGTSIRRRSLWPPEATVTPTDYTSQGLLDRELGLPLDSPTCTLVAPYTSCASQELARLKKQFQACVGPALPTACTTGADLDQMKAARREARDIILAFMAGAATIPDTTGVKRTTAAVGSSPARSLLFKARSWVLADSELATTAVVTQPNLNEPVGTPYVAEYQLFRDGPRDASTGKNPDSAGDQIRQGFGLTSPDDDGTVGSGYNDTRVNLKPVMTVVYAPSNDMLHAFRAGPRCSPSTASCSETGGEELWGFVPYDQLAAVGLRAANEPQGRNNHVYMLARGVRFADVFVPGAMTGVSIGGVTVPSMQGVWRRVLYFGRGIGGKYVTALDVTAPGPFTATALSTVAPIPLWSRGNPDTSNGLSTGGTDNGSSADRTAYERMGETWSLPTVAYVNKDKTNPIYTTTRRPDGIDFAIFMGSGYGAAGEGTTHYALDALSGDVIAAVDVEDTAASYGLTRTLCATDPATGKPIETAACAPMPNALVANSVSFNRSAFAGVAAKVFNVNPHPWSNVSARVYVGDLHGRLWKFLTASPDVAIPAADLGVTQPIGTAVALLADGTDPATNVPMILVSAGADKRASGPFRSFSLRDNGPDTLSIPATTGTVTNDGVTAFTPVEALFARDFDQGDPEANCGYPTEAVFRGTIQPAGAVECSVPLAGGGKCPGDLWERVFFGGTRLSLPNTKYAPPTPLSCGTGTYPCRSQFDSILYALGAITGQAAYDLNAGSSDDAYRIFRDSRLAAITMQADPDPGRGGSSLTPDEGLMKGTPAPPPPPGVPPTATTATANVVFKREAGQPAPAVRYGSTVCQ